MQGLWDLSKIADFVSSLELDQLMMKWSPLAIQIGVYAP